MGDLHWKTSITKIEPNKISVRGYPIDYLMGKVSFAQAIYLILKGELPDEKTGKLIDTILVSSIDHGATPPSTLAARTIASTGSPLNAALAGGILAIYRYHGGAIEDAMKFYLDGLKRAEETGKSLADIALEMVKEKKEKREKVFGFGHRYHTNDPRTKKLFEIARETGYSGKYIEFAQEVQKALSTVLGKNLPINVDGAIAAVLCELDFPPELGNAFFIMARTPGIIAHIYEEQTRMKPMRKIHPTDHEYDGPERNL